MRGLPRLLSDIKRIKAWCFWDDVVQRKMPPPYITPVVDLTILAAEASTPAPFFYALYIYYFCICYYSCGETYLHSYHPSHIDPGYDLSHGHPCPLGGC